MAITTERLKQTFSEGGAQEIYQEVKSGGDFLGFARQYAFDTDYRVARSALWGLTKARPNELSPLQVLLDDFIEQAIHTENSSVRRLTLNIIERLTIGEEDLRTDFLDFCIDHAIMLDELPGIQSVSLKLAFRMCQFYPELMDELKRTLQTMDIDYYKPAVRGVRAKILNGTLMKKSIVTTHKKEKFMVYQRNSKKCERVQKWVSWYCFNRNEDGSYEAELDEAWYDGSHNGGGTIIVAIPKEWFSLSYDEFLGRVITLASASQYGFTSENLKEKKGLKELFGF